MTADAIKKTRLSAVKCFLLDMDGTFYLGDRLLEGSLSFLAKLAETNRSALFVTNNSSKSAAMYMQKLERMGVPAAFRNVLTSGQVAGQYALRHFPGKRAYVLGNTSLREELAGMGLTLDGACSEGDGYTKWNKLSEGDVRSEGNASSEGSESPKGGSYPKGNKSSEGRKCSEKAENHDEAENPEEAVTPGYVLIGYDTTLTYNKLTRVCDLVRQGLPYIATHPDLNCPTEIGYAPDIGATTAFIEASTGRKPDVILGKPYAGIAEEALRRTGLPAEELAVVGDRLYTDIATGVNFGMTSILVLTGETGLEDLASSDIQPDMVFQRLSDMNEYL